MRTLLVFSFTTVSSLLLALATGCGDGTEPPLPDCTVTQWTHQISSGDDPASSLFQCEQRTPDISSTGQVACLVIEARSDEPCACDAADARGPVTPEHAGAIEVVQARVGPEFGCFCEVPPLEGPARDACQSDSADTLLVDGQPVDGWCYIDATLAPPLGNPEMVASCPSNNQRAVRMVGKGVPASPGAVLVILCEQQNCAE